MTLEPLAEVFEKTNRKPEAERIFRRCADLRLQLIKDWPHTPYFFIQAGNMLAAWPTWSLIEVTSPRPACFRSRRSPRSKPA